MDTNRVEVILKNYFEFILNLFYKMPEMEESEKSTLIQKVNSFHNEIQQELINNKNPKEYYSVGVKEIKKQLEN